MDITINTFGLKELPIPGARILRRGLDELKGLADHKAGKLCRQEILADRRVFAIGAEPALIGHGFPGNGKGVDIEFISPVLDDSAVHPDHGGQGFSRAGECPARNRYANAGEKHFFRPTQVPSAWPAAGCASPPE